MLRATSRSCSRAAPPARSRPAGTGVFVFWNVKGRSPGSGCPRTPGEGGPAASSAAGLTGAGPAGWRSPPRPPPSARTRTAPGDERGSRERGVPSPSPRRGRAAAVECAHTDARDPRRPADPTRPPAACDATQGHDDGHVGLPVLRSVEGSVSRPRPVPPPELRAATCSQTRGRRPTGKPPRPSGGNDVSPAHPASGRRPESKAASVGGGGAAPTRPPRLLR